jgi:phage baseplate assembly protein gpV
MLRLGVISELGEGENAGFARVFFDENNFVSGWLSLPSTNTKTVKQWIPVEVNSQVACLMDEYCKQGCIVAVLWSDTDTPPEWASKDTIGIKFADGAEVYYSAAENKFAVNAPSSEVSVTCKSLSANAEDGITLNGGENGGLTVTPKLVEQLEKMSARIDGIIDAINNGVPVPQDGGAGLQTTIKASLSAIVDKEDFSEVENDKVKH